MQWFHVSWLRADTYDQTVIAQSLAAAIIFLSFVVVTGMGGMVSLAQATFVTAGGFGAGWALTRNWGIDIPLIATHGQLNFVWAALIAAIVAAALGALIALPATRLGAVYLAIWSLAAAFFFSLVVVRLRLHRQGPAGLDDPRAEPAACPALNWVHRLLTRAARATSTSASSPIRSCSSSCLFGLITAVIHAPACAPPSGRAILAVRSSETAAEAAGHPGQPHQDHDLRPLRRHRRLRRVMLSLFSFAASNSTAPPDRRAAVVALAVLFGVRRPGGRLLAGFSAVAGFLRRACTPLPLPCPALRA